MNLISVTREKNMMFLGFCDGTDWSSQGDTDDITERCEEYGWPEFGTFRTEEFIDAMHEQFVSIITAIMRDDETWRSFLGLRGILGEEACGRALAHGFRLMPEMPGKTCVMGVLGKFDLPMEIDVDREGAVTVVDASSSLDAAQKLMIRDAYLRARDDILNDG